MRSSQEFTGRVWGRRHLRHWIFCRPPPEVVGEAPQFSRAQAERVVASDIPHIVFSRRMGDSCMYVRIGMGRRGGKALPFVEIGSSVNSTLAV